MKRLFISAAQARSIAQAWAENKAIKWSGGEEAYNPPTHRALRNNYLIEPTGIKGTFESGKPYELYRLTDRALAQLELFLSDQRYKREKKS